MNIRRELWHGVGLVETNAHAIHNSLHTMNSKTISQSKTFWVQVIAMAASFFPPVGAWVAANPVAAVSALGGLNILVRFVTHGKVTIFPGDSMDDGTGNGLGGPLVKLLLIGVMTTALMGALSSCSTTVTTNVLPDGTKVTITAKSADPVAIKAALDAAQIITPVVDKLIVKQTSQSAAH